VNGNHINATQRGISFNYNNGSQYCVANDNIINIANGDTSAIGIRCGEITPNANAHYIIENNSITIKDGHAGIVSSYCLGTRINYNTIRQLTAKANPTMTYGIKILASDTVTVTCNSITSEYPTDTNGTSVGMYLDQSLKFNMSCNHVKHEDIGIFLSGNCAASNDLVGNTLDTCYLGLRLYSNAIIGQQLHKGNRWLQLANGKNGAENNNPFPNTSLFVVHDSIVGTIYHPKNNWPPGQWFFYQPGTPLACGNTCLPQFTTAEDTNLLERIVNDSSLAYLFDEETRSLAQQSVYELFDRNIALRNSDSLFLNFYLL
jgi:hypothetical protein